MAGPDRGAAREERATSVRAEKAGGPPFLLRSVPEDGARRRVDWPLVVPANSFRAPLATAPTDLDGTAEVLRAVDALSAQREEAALLRGAIGVLRSHLGLDRAAIFVRGTAEDLLYGTFGTDVDGATTDEREIAFLIGAAHREAFARSHAGLASWLLLEHAPLTAQRAGRTEVITHGWNALTPIRSARGTMGLLVNDSACRGEPVDPARQARAGLFCAMLGNLLELARAERRLRAEELSAAGGVCALPASDGVIRVLSRLQAEPSLSRRELSRAAGVSESALSRCFKKEMGISLAQYRSRLKLERFLALVDPQEGNLLKAALQAGFGSYAQFHRVFRAALGTTPKEYLASRYSLASK